MPEITRNLQVREYIHRKFCLESEDLRHVKSHSAEINLKPIAVSPGVGKMLEMLCHLQSPKRILEIGTLGGYSALWLAKGMAAGGYFVTIESSEKNAGAARGHFMRAGLDIEVKIGSAELILRQMESQGELPFDLIFIDADKPNYLLYLDLSIALSREGTLIITDNLIPKRGELENPDPRDKEALSIYAFNDYLAVHPRLETTLLPTIAGNGNLDALGVSLVKSLKN